MKIKTLFLLLSFFVSGFCLFSERVFPINENFKYPSLLVRGDRIYIYDVDCVIHAYSEKSKKILFSFGKKGEGPGEFKWIARACPYDDYFCICSPFKTSYFSVEGKLLKEKVNSFDATLMPLKNNFIHKTSEWDINIPVSTYVFSIMDEDFHKIREIYRTKTHFYQRTTPDGQKELFLTRECVQNRIYQDKLFIGTAEKEGSIVVFNSDGKKIKEIHTSFDQKSLTEEGKEEYIKLYFGEKISHRNLYRIIWHRKYLPAFSNFFVDNDLIYVLGYPGKPISDPYQELRIFDFNGKKIKETKVINVPYEKVESKAFYIANGFFYYLQENKDTENWELFKVKI